MKKALITAVSTIVALALIAIIYAYSGIFDPGALVPHNKITLWFINKTSDISIEKRARNIIVPNLEDSTLSHIGFAHYNEMCVYCHGAPGLEASEAIKGLYPQAPEIYKYANELDAKETFWTIKNGLKMTAMPAFATTHSDDEIWAITAFMTKNLGKMSAAEYKKWQNKYSEKE